MKKSWLNLTFSETIIYLTILFCSVVTIVPILHVFFQSISSGRATQSTVLFLYPKELTFEAYRYVFATNIFPRSIGITVLITVLGTFLNMIFTTLGAYSLSRQVPGTGIMLIFVIIPMVLSAGIIPTYVIVKNLHMLNTIWAMIIPSLVAPFYLILMRNFFWGIPNALIETAQIEGCNEWRIMASVIIPLSLPVMATIGLFYAVGHWNEFFAGIFYLTDRKLWPLQVLLRSIVMQSDFSGMNAEAALSSGKSNTVPQTIQSASVVVATAPIVLLYPFLQKYFVRGIVLGAVKG